MEEIFAVTVFVAVLIVMATELAHRTVAALLGALVVVSFGVVWRNEAAAEIIDWNTIGLLAGMMGMESTSESALLVATVSLTESGTSGRCATEDKLSIESPAPPDDDAGPEEAPHPFGSLRRNTAPPSFAFSAVRSPP